MLFDPLALKNKHPSFTIWNLKGHGDGAKKWFPAGMGTTTGLAMEKFTAPNGKLIKPVSEIPKRVIRVAVNEYPPLVNKVLPGAGKECFGRFVACYENSRENMSANTQPKMFCCFGASLDFLSFLQKDLNFDAYIYFTPDGKFGVFNSSTGEWNGIVQELISGRAALSLELGLNSRRAEVLEYAHPTLLLELGILVKNGHKGRFILGSLLLVMADTLLLSLVSKFNTRVNHTTKWPTAYTSRQKRITRLMILTAEQYLRFAIMQEPIKVRELGSYSDLTYLFIYFSRLGSWLFCLVLVSLAHEDVLGHQLKLWLFWLIPLERMNFPTRGLMQKGTLGRQESNGRNLINCLCPLASCCTIVPLPFRQK